MPIARTAGLPQQDLATSHYGALPIEGMPTPPVDVDAQLAYWYKPGPQDGGQWVFVRLTTGSGLEMVYSAAEGTLTLQLDAAIKRTLPGTAVLRRTEAITFSAAAELV